MKKRILIISGSVLIILIIMIVAVSDPVRTVINDLLNPNKVETNTKTKFNPPTVTGLDNTPAPPYTGTIAFNPDDVVSGAIFTYKFKKSRYDTRGEVLDEIESLRKAFENYRIENMYSANLYYDELEWDRLRDYLNLWLEKYPMTEQEKHDANVKMFYNTFEMIKSDLEMEYRQYKNGKKSYESYIKFKEEYYDKVAKAKDDYESEKIDIIEALELIGDGEFIVR